MNELNIIEAYCRADRALGLRITEIIDRYRGMLPDGALARDAIYTELLGRASTLWYLLPGSLRNSIARPDHVATEDHGGCI